MYIYVYINSVKRNFIYIIFYAWKLKRCVRKIWEIPSATFESANLLCDLPMKSFGPAEHFLQLFPLHLIFTLKSLVIHCGCFHYCFTLRAAWSGMWISAKTHARKFCCLIQQRCIFCFHVKNTSSGTYVALKVK